MRINEEEVVGGEGGRRETSWTFAHGRELLLMLFVFDVFSTPRIGTLSIHVTLKRKNANKMARVLPLHQGFVRDTAEFGGIHFHYSMRGAKPGLLSGLSPVYLLFSEIAFCSKRSPKFGTKWR